jgi:chromate reductase
MKVLGVCGALSAQSLNKEAILLAAELAPRGVTLTEDTQLGRLPLFNPDLEVEGDHPEVYLWRQLVSQHDALLVMCPEYGFSLPGPLKNGIDWLIGSGELEGKAIATTAIVAGEGRGLMGLDALHTTLSAVSARTCGRRPIVRWTDAASLGRVKRELQLILEELTAIVSGG